MTTVKLSKRRRVPDGNVRDGETEFYACWSAYVRDGALTMVTVSDDGARLTERYIPLDTLWEFTITKEDA
jgi:hypothetical protein